MNQFISALQPSQPLETMDTRADRSVEQKGSDDAVPTGADEDPDVVMSSIESDDTVVKAADALEDDVPGDDVSENDASDGDWGSDDSSDSDDDVADVLFQQRRAPAMQTHEVPKSAQKILTQCEKLLPLLMQSHTFKIPPAQINSVQNILQELQKKVDSFKTNQVPVEVKTAVQEVIVSCRGLSMGLKDREKAIGQHELYCIDVNSFKRVLESWRSVMADASSSSSSSGKAEASATISSDEYKQFVINVCNAILKVTEHQTDEYQTDHLTQIYLLNKQVNISELLECLQQDDFVFNVGNDEEVKFLISFVNGALEKLDTRLHQGNNGSDRNVPRNKPSWDAFCSRVTAKVDSKRLIECDRASNDNLVDGWILSAIETIKKRINDLSEEQKSDDITITQGICGSIEDVLGRLSSFGEIAIETKRSLVIYIKYWIGRNLPAKLEDQAYLTQAVKNLTAVFMREFIPLSNTLSQGVSRTLSQGVRSSSERTEPQGMRLEAFLALVGEEIPNNAVSAASMPTPQPSSDETSIVQEIVNQMKKAIHKCEGEKASGTDAATYEQIFVLELENIISLYSAQLCEFEGHKLKTEISAARSIQGELQALLQGSTVSDLEAVTQDTMREFMEGLDEMSNPSAPMAFSTGSSSSSSSSNEHSALTDLQVRDIIEQIQGIVEYAESGDAIQNIIKSVLNNLRRSNITPSEKVNRVSPLCEVLTVLSTFSTDAAIAASAIAGFVRESAAADFSSSSSSSSSTGATIATSGTVDFVSELPKESAAADSSSSSSTSSSPGAADDSMTDDNRSAGSRKRPSPGSSPGSESTAEEVKRQRTSSSSSSFFSDPTSGCDPATSAPSNSAPASESMDATEANGEQSSTSSQPKL